MPRPFSVLSMAVAGALIVSAMAPACALAQSAPPAGRDLMPPAPATTPAQSAADLNSETHPSLKLSPDKSELVPLDREATSVIVGNPDHIGVLLDTPRLAVVIPRAPGATYFTVLDKNGAVVMQRHVIVAAPKKNYVRVRRSCGNAAQGTSCKPTSVYFCPDICHEIGNVPAGDAAAPAEAAPAPTE